ncbi:hypothetical protein J3E68DRAFT_424952 [Trichoderma sp. SZMC 28012]
MEEFIRQPFAVYAYRINKTNPLQGKTGSQWNRWVFDWRNPSTPDFMLIPSNLKAAEQRWRCCYIFQGIMDHTDMQMEKYFQLKTAAGEAYQAVPEESLAATIIYTPHFLRWTE